MSFVLVRLADRLGDFAIMIALVAVLAVFERFLPAEPGQSIAGRLRNISFMAVSQFAGGILVSLIAYLVLPYLLLDGSGYEHRALLASAAIILLHLLLGDFVFYWYHRAQHSSSVLWPIHELHHSEAELNATSSLRTYLLERPIQFVVISIPLALLFAHVPWLDRVRLTSEDAGRMYLVSLAWLFFAHANVRLQLGRLSSIAMGPQLHRIHHSIESRHHGRNFAQFFPLLDVAFGTYWQPEAGEFPKTGTLSMPSRVALTHALWRPFRYWARAPAAVVRKRAAKTVVAGG